MTKGNKPAAKFRLGYVAATVWKNENFYSVNLVRSYKDEKGDWQETDSLSSGDLLNAAKCLERAEGFIAEQ